MTTTDIEPNKVTLVLENDKFALNSAGDVVVRVADDDALAVLQSIAAALGGSNSATQTIFNETIALANTEQSLVLPASIKGYLIRTRGNSELKLTHVSGESGTKFITIPKNATYESKYMYQNLTLYFQSSTAGDIVEVIVWE